LRALEARLEKGRYLCGARRSLADMALFPFVRQFAATAPDWFAGQPVPKVQGWLADLVGSEIFARAMVRLAPWREGHAPILLRL
jgi:glutathione S-transferase